MSTGWDWLSCIGVGWHWVRTALCEYLFDVHLDSDSLNI